MIKNVKFQGGGSANYYIFITFVSDILKMIK